MSAGNKTWNSNLGTGDAHNLPPLIPLRAALLMRLSHLPLLCCPHVSQACPKSSLITQMWAAAPWP